LEKPPRRSVEKPPRRSVERPPRRGVERPPRRSVDRPPYRLDILLPTETMTGKTYDKQIEKKACCSRPARLENTQIIMTMIM
jgi:hypothetical protein